MDQVEEIKRKIDVVDLISSYLSLQKAGRNFRACCPFHKEKTASFMVSPEKQIWYCFGCNQGGDIFTFIEKIEGLDFVGALNLLAEKAGVILDRKSPIQKGKKEKIFNILEIANRFFVYMLNEHIVGKEAKHYLVDKRKLNDKTIQDFSLGYAPDNSNLLKSFLLKKGFTEKEIFDAGLLAEKGRSTIDKYRDRIIFPIKNTNGKIVGFGGRIFREKKDDRFTPPKYLNSPQTEVYDKSSTIYGLYEARDSIREKDLAIIVEGYLDVISSHQAGIKNVIASSGTALTERQVEIVSRYTGNIAFCFDSDEAGQIATKRAMEMTRFSDINIKAIVLPEGKDPDELINKDSALWEHAAGSPVPIIDFYYSNVLKNNNFGKDAESKKVIAKEMIPIVAGIGNDVEKAHWVQKMSQDLGIAEKYIIEALSKTKVAKDPNLLSQNISQSVNIRIPKEVLLILSLIIFPAKVKKFLETLNEEDFGEELAKKLYKKISIWHNNNENEKSTLDIEYLKSGFTNEEKSSLDVLFFLTSSFFEELKEHEAFDDVEELIKTVLQNKKQKRKKEIEIELSILSKAKDKEKIKQLLRELQSLV